MTPPIRPECLKPASEWTPPSGAEVRAVLSLAKLSGSDAAKLLGLGSGGGRTVRRWTAGDVVIPYAAWSLLCQAAGLGVICFDSKEKGGHFPMTVFAVTQGPDDLKRLQKTYGNEKP